MSATPQEERVASAGFQRSGRLSPSGLADFLARYSSGDSVEEFVKWRSNPTTVRFLAAIRSLATNIPPAFLNRSSVELQYGVSSGLGLAASLIDDPSTVYPELFTNPTPVGDPESAIAAGYTSEPDA